MTTCITRGRLCGGVSWLRSLRPYVEATPLREAPLSSQDRSQTLCVGVSVSGCKHPAVSLAQACFWLNMPSRGWYNLALNLCGQPFVLPVPPPFHLRARSGVRLLPTSQGVHFNFSNSLPFLIISALDLGQLIRSSSIGKQTFVDFATSYW